jgi:hypothetical protein
VKGLRSKHYKLELAARSTQKCDTSRPPSCISSMAVYSRLRSTRTREFCQVPFRATLDLKFITLLQYDEEARGWLHGRFCTSSAVLRAGESPPVRITTSFLVCLSISGGDKILRLKDISASGKSTEDVPGNLGSFNSPTIYFNIIKSASAEAFPSG